MFGVNLSSFWLWGKWGEKVFYPFFSHAQFSLIYRTKKCNMMQTSKMLNYMMKK